MVALSTLCGLLVPSVLVRMSWTPAASRDNAGTLRGGGQQHPRRAVVARDLEGNGRVLEGHEDQILLGVLDRLPDRFRYLAGLAQPHADVPPPVSHHDQRGEGEP